MLILESLSRGYLGCFRLQNAENSLRLWLERRPDDVQALLWHGEVEERLLRKEEALAAYRRAVELSLDQDDARHSLWPEKRATRWLTHHPGRK